MKQEYDNKDIGDIIDKSFEAGYQEAVRKAVKWLDENWTSFVSHYEEDGVVYYLNLTDAFEKYMKK